MIEIFSGSDQKSNKKEADQKYQSRKNEQSEDYCEDNRQGRKSWRKPSHFMTIKEQIIA